METSSIAPHKPTQEARLLEILKSRGVVSNFELRDLQPPIFQVPARIFGLIQKGEPIVGFHDEHDRRKYWYKYLSIPADLFGGAAA